MSLIRYLPYINLPDMKKNRKIGLRVAVLLMAAVVSLSFTNKPADDGFTFGKSTHQSIGTLTFSPDGTLFFADFKGAAIYGIRMSNEKADAQNTAVNIADLDTKVADMMGATAREIRVMDMATNPQSKTVYFSVARGVGNDTQYALMKITRDGDSKNGKVEAVSLDAVDYASYSLKDAPATTDKDRRGRSLRTMSITDIAFHNNEVYVAGLSNEEFSSTFRRIPFPFQGTQTASKVEIFHVAHGRYETNAPIQTFMPMELDGKAHIVAAYTCTPLVTFPVGDVEDGGHIMGKTAAELGSNNRPVDIISFKRGGKQHIVLSNSNRSAMRFDPKDLIKQETLKTPLEERFKSTGVPYVQLPLVQVLQLDDFNEDHLAVMQRGANGALNFRSIPKQWLSGI